MNARFLHHRWFLRGLRWILGLVFVYAGVAKLLAPLDFADSIAGFLILPPAAVNLLALVLPPFEIMIGALLFVGWRTRAAALAVLFLTTVFASAMVFALIRGLSVDCGCFGGGASSRLHTWTSLGRDLFLLGAAAFLYSRHPPDRPRSAA